MNSGRLRHRVSIQTKQNGLNEYGEMEDSWVECCKRWADVRQRRGTEVDEAQRVQAEYDYSVRMRKTSIGPRDRIVHGDKVLSVLSAAMDRTEERYITVFCAVLEV